MGGRKGQIPWNKGMKYPKEWNKPMPEETKIKIRNTMKGRKKSAEQIEKNRLGHLGKKQSPEIIEKRFRNCRGEKHYKWIKDRSKVKKSEHKHLDGLYRYWSKEVKNRDNWKCKINNKYCNGKLEAHHILPWSKFPELRYEINNGISLCHFHHPRKINDEIKLVSFFKRLIQ
jgi:hypothetical protein